jgi:hypothetical protein
MKNYNKLPYKERKRHFDYAERQEKTLMEREIKRLEKSKRDSYEEQECKSEKEREAEEFNELFKAISERSGK